MWSPQLDREDPMMKSSRIANTTSDTDDKLILWVAVDTQRDHVQEARSINIHHYSTPNTPCPPWFSPNNVQALQTILGTDYACHTKRLSALHQAVVTPEILRHQHLVQIAYRKSPNDALALLTTMKHRDKKKVLVWLDVHQNVHPYDWMFAYDMLTHECGAIFPLREEIIWADFKIYDMRAFDRVAAADGTYRPRACYPVGAKHTCHLGNSIKTVLKRSHSCAADQVSIVPVGKRGVPVCEHLPVSDQGPMSGGFYRWVHQEYVASLVTFGEFRVYVATRKGAGGAREPYVVYTIRTWWTKGEQERFRDDDDVHGTNTLGTSYQAAPVLRGDTWHEYPLLNYDMLVAYALHTYCQLQNLDEKGFQSLDVGGRLDIGIAPNGEQFFVNELTRWYGAHHFALETQPHPGDNICRAYAKAFAETRCIDARNEAEDS
jgi:hypothetical protein